MPTALITGISGQDGSYLAEILLDKGYTVVGTVRGSPVAHYPRIAHLRDAIELIEGGRLDEGAVGRLLRKYRPTEIYNLASTANSALSFIDQVMSSQCDSLDVLRLLESIRMVDPAVRFCQASTSELFGGARESPQSEATPFYPRNPYGVAKLYGHWITVNYRETQGLFACSAILFNHVSPRHSDSFVVRKVSSAAARIKLDLQDCLYLGDLDARRDWGYAADYMRALWRMLQSPTARDYVLATGETHSVREACDIAFRHLGLDYRKFVVSEPQGHRTIDGAQLVGDSRNAQRDLDLRRTLTFEQLVCAMVEADLDEVTRIRPVAPTQGARRGS